jgi:hypothetical protein
MALANGEERQLGFTFNRPRHLDIFTPRLKSYQELDRLVYADIRPFRSRSINAPPRLFRVRRLLAVTVHAIYTSYTYRVGAYVILDAVWVGAKWRMASGWPKGAMGGPWFRFLVAQ